MGLLDVLGSLGKATHEQLPGIMQRSEQRNTRRANADFGSRYHQAMMDGDKAGMRAVLQEAPQLGVSPEVIREAQTAQRTFENDEREKAVEDLRLTLESSTDPYSKADARLKMYRFANPNASEEEMGRMRENYMAMAEQEKKIQAAGVETAEGKAQEATAKGKLAVYNADEAERMTKAKTEISTLLAGGTPDGRQKAVLIAQQNGLDTMAKALSGTVFDKDKNSAERGMSKDYMTMTKKFREVRDAYARMKVVGDKPSAAGDLALIFNYMKMLDPGSTVREGEFATAQNTTGVPQRILNMYNNFVDGSRLGKLDDPAHAKQRQDFLNQAANLYGAAYSGYQRDAKTFTDLATGAGLRPAQVVFDQGLADWAAGVEGAEDRSDDYIGDSQAIVSNAQAALNRDVGNKPTGEPRPRRSPMDKRGKVTAGATGGGDQRPRRPRRTAKSGQVYEYNGTTKTWVPVFDTEQGEPE